MGTEATSAGWDSSLADLVRRGSRRIVVVPLMVSSHGGHYREIEYYAGLRPRSDVQHVHHDVDPPRVPVSVTPALDASVELGQALAVNWSLLDSADRRRPLLLVAHGPSDSLEARRWIENLNTAVRPLMDAGLEREPRVQLLLDDAPPEVRAAAVSGMRALVSTLSGGDSVVVLPVLISMGDINQRKIPTDLAGLPVRYFPAPLAPSPHLARWIERSAAEQLIAIAKPRG